MKVYSSLCRKDDPLTRQSLRSRGNRPQPKVAFFEFCCWYLSAPGAILLCISDEFFPQAPTPDILTSGGDPAARHHQTRGSTSSNADRGSSQQHQGGANANAGKVRLVSRGMDDLASPYVSLRFRTSEMTFNNPPPPRACVRTYPAISLRAVCGLHDARCYLLVTTTQTHIDTSNETNRQESCSIISKYFSPWCAFTILKHPHTPTHRTRLSLRETHAVKRDQSKPMRA